MKNEHRVDIHLQENKFQIICITLTYDYICKCYRQSMKCKTNSGMLRRRINYLLLALNAPHTYNDTSMKHSFIFSSNGPEGWISSIRRMFYRVVKEQVKMLTWISKIVFFYIYVMSDPPKAMHSWRIWHECGNHFGWSEKHNFTHTLLNGYSKVVYLTKNWVVPCSRVILLTAGNRAMPWFAQSGSLLLCYTLKQMYSFTRKNWAACSI